ncbi:hypothetical protein ACFO5X_25195 [Seohaeicola nanhaiensis]|uniref:Uncharacterized protein n=1 Tax=Seohaeicola nanhaiensis TaxID=1387282 RepID=A0ABV9KPE0_9RHOB
MKLFMTTAAISALLATGVIAETTSRGADAPTAQETVGTELKADAAKSTPEASRGAGNPSSEEVAKDPAVPAVDQVATGETPDASRGAEAVRSEDVAKDTNAAATTGVVVAVPAADKDADTDKTASRGADNPTSEEVAEGKADANVYKTKDSEVEASRGEDAVRGEDVAGDQPSTNPSEASRGADNASGEEITTGNDS